MMARKKMDPEEEQLWKQYRKTKSDEIRNQLVLRFLPLVREIAHSLGRRLSPNANIDDLVSSGCRGLMDAVKGFRRNRKNMFATYATLRIRGAMLDDVRTADHASRLTRLHQRNLNKARIALTLQLQRVPTDDELAEFMQLTSAQFLELTQRVDATGLKSLATPVKRGNSDDGGIVPQLGDQLEDHSSEDPAAAQQRADLKALITKGLNKTERLVMLLYYDENPLTMREIGKTLNLSESRVSQMHDALVKRLRKTMAHRRNEFV